MSSDTNDLNIESDENTLKNLEVGVKAYENKLKDLEIAIEQFSSKFGIISEKLLDVLLIRDKIKKDWLPDITRGSANLGLKINELDRELKINFRTINEKVKPKTKIEIVASLEEFKDLMEIVSKDWWWNLKIYSSFIERLNPVWKFLSFGFFAISLTFFCKIVYAWTSGLLILRFWSSLVTSVGSILSVFGLQALFTDYTKKFTLDSLKLVQKILLFKDHSSHSFYRWFVYRYRWITLFIGGFVFSLVSWLWLLFLIPKQAQESNNQVVDEYWNPKSSLEDKKNQLKLSAKFNPDDKDIRKNLAQAYIDLYDYDNAIAEYKALLPDFEAVTALTRLSLLGLDKNKNDSNYIAHLIYLMQMSYNQLCIIDHRYKYKLNITSVSPPNECHFFDILMSRKNNQEFQYEFQKNQYLISSTYEFFYLRGWTRMNQRQYQRAKEDLIKSIDIIDIILKFDKKNSINQRKIRKAKSSCLLVQVLDKLNKTSNKISKSVDQSYKTYKKNCFEGIDSFKSVEDWKEWSQEYDLWSNPDLVKPSVKP